VSERSEDGADASAGSDETAGRLDRWLWAVRAYKTRGDAADACRAGAVENNGRTVKPARHVRPAEVIAVKQGLVTRTLVVRGVPRSRVGAPLVPDYCDEQTPASEWEKAKAHRLQQVLAREPGSGRPTKRDRRELERLFGG
jgi:ribosome-associated heat shock protein Hsp15